MMFFQDFPQFWPEEGDNFLVTDDIEICWIWENSSNIDDHWITLIEVKICARNIEYEMPISIIHHPDWPRNCSSSSDALSLPMLLNEETHKNHVVVVDR